MAATGGTIRPDHDKQVRIARFGMFELNIPAGELMRQGLRLKVQDQPFRVLQYLVERAGEIVTREELQSHLWPDGTFVDFEHSLNTAIKKLRQALDDGADNPRFIETVPRRGYRFIAPVQWVGLQMVRGEEVPAEATSGAPSRPSSKAMSAAALLAIVIGIAAAMHWWPKTQAPAAPVSYTVTPLTTYPGSEYFGALSPDGERVAFAWDQGKNTGLMHIFVKQIGTEQPLQLTSGEMSELAPTWSPDGKYIAFVRLDVFAPPETADIYIMSSLGGSERKIATIQIRSKLGFAFAPNMSWSPDGKTLAYVDRTPGGNNFAVFLLNLENLTSRQLTFPAEHAGGDGIPEYSPDGKTIAFLRTTKEAADVYTVPASGGEAKRITKENRIALFGLAWTSDGKNLVYSGFGVWMVPASGGVGRQILSVPIACDLNVVGNRLIFSQSSFEENIYATSLDGTRVGRSWSKAFASTKSEEGMRFSPDGKRVAFQSSRTGGMEIWVSEPDGSNPVRLTNFGGPLTGSARWSPDGQTIVFDSRPDGNADIFAVSPNGGQPRQLTHDKSDEVMPSFSHDGNWIYFASDRGGAWNVWKMPASGGTAIQITKEEGFTALESPDGKYLYYAKGISVPGLWRVPVNGGREEPVIEDLQPTLYGYWAMTRDGIYYGKMRGNAQITSAELYFYSFSSKKSVKIADLPYQLFTGAPGLEVTPDRKKIMVVMGQSLGSDLEMIENFH